MDCHGFVQEDSLVLKGTSCYGGGAVWGVIRISMCQRYGM